MWNTWQALGIFMGRPSIVVRGVWRELTAHEPGVQNRWFTRLSPWSWIPLRSLSSPAYQRPCWSPTCHELWTHHLVVTALATIPPFHLPPHPGTQKMSTAAISLSFPSPPVNLPLGILYSKGLWSQPRIRSSLVNLFAFCYNWSWDLLGFLN